MKLSDEDRAERAQWLVAALDELESQKALAKEIAAEHREQSKRLEARIAVLKREVGTGHTDDQQATLPGVG